MSPLVATFIGFFFLHQTLTPLQILGIAIVLISVALGQQSQQLRQPPNPLTALFKSNL